MPHIFHITHLRNLTGIAAAGGLNCDRTAQNLPCVRIGYQHIKERRLNRVVPIPPGDCVGDYVPFYFAPRSPMLYAIHRGLVDGYTGGQSEILHLVATTENVALADVEWVFTDGHAEMAPLTDFYDDLKDLDKIDWNVMKATYWHDTDDDPDKKRRRQAEFLVHRFFPWTLISAIGVHGQAIADEVAKLLQNENHKPDIRIARNWYY